VCTVSYQARLGPLTKPVDIYCEWIDNAEKINQKQKSLGLQDRQLKKEEIDSEYSDDEDDVSAL
jgi:transcription elongation factor Elf1